MAKNWAICIGINHYHYLQDLTCAVNDAEKMHVWLKETAKFEKTYLFTDNSPVIEDMSESFPSEPTCATLSYWLDRRFPPKSKPPLSLGDSLWFFFSGHGVQEQGQHYLLTKDSFLSAENAVSSAINLAWITEKLRQSGAGNIMLFVDACRSVAKSGLGIELQPEQGIISIASCRPREKSYEIEALNHGSFTYALLESLQIQGENNCATVERLAKRLKDRVATLNREYKKPVQTPYTRIEPETKNHLIFLPERIQPTLNDIAVLKNNAFKAEFILNDLKLAQMLWHRLVPYDQDEAIDRLTEIRLKLRQPGLNSTVSLPSESIQTSSPKSPNSSSSPSLQVLTQTLSGNIKLEMVKIPAGSFTMGSPDTDDMAYGDEKPQHRVNLQEFYLGKYPVTQEQYQAVMGSNPSYFENNPKNPVEQVSWDDAQEFCKKLNQLTGKEFRLPTEAEWEYACRAGTQTRYYFGDDQSVLKEYAWYGDNSGDSLLNTVKIWDADPNGDNYYKKLMDNNCKTHPVGKKKPNNWGLYDMSGNVWEWCEDPWHDSYANKPDNIKNDGNIIWSSSDELLRVLRGGSWDYNSRDCRSANRFRYDADVRIFNFGFRLAVSAF
ncbi:MAG: SUMF1/EgtB/PvdO family nonheme iron enzyme [Snowella sp.]|nr:SUMF1/EgtB/PvdO family nonheme iron enzyme [Snowella sp.]